MPPTEPRPARSSLTPDDTSAQALVVRGIEAIEGHRAQLQAVEKSLDGLRSDSASIRQHIAEVEGVLKRIAAAEEERTKLLRDGDARREAWAARLWSTPAVQLLVMALVLGLLNLAGLRWAVDQAISTAAPESLVGSP